MTQRYKTQNRVSKDIKSEENLMKRLWFTDLTASKNMIIIPVPRVNFDQTKEEEETLCQDLGFYASTVF